MSNFHIIETDYNQLYNEVLLSGTFFLVSMLFLKFARSVPTFVVAYIFYALAQAVTPAPQVEIIRSVIPDATYFGTAFAIKKSVVQACQCSFADFECESTNTYVDL